MLQTRKPRCFKPDGLIVSRAIQRYDCITKKEKERINKEDERKKKQRRPSRRRRNRLNNFVVRNLIKRSIPVASIWTTTYSAAKFEYRPTKGHSDRNGKLPVGAFPPVKWVFD